MGLMVLNVLGVGAAVLTVLVLTRTRLGLVAPCAATRLLVVVFVVPVLVTLVSCAGLMAHAGAHSDDRALCGAGALAAALLVVAGLPVAVRFAVLHRRARAPRRRHLRLLMLLAAPRADLDHALVLTDERAFAYSLPRLRRGHVVMSSALVEELPADLCRAVLDHERRHLSGRHHLVVQLVSAVSDAYGWTSGGRRLRDRGATLVELSADCSAVRRSGSEPLLRAMMALTSCRSTTLPTTGTHEARIANLKSSQGCCSRWRSAAVDASALVVLGIPVVALFLGGDVTHCLL